MNAETFTKMVAKKFDELKQEFPEEREVVLKTKATEWAEAEALRPVKLRAVGGNGEDQSAIPGISTSASK